MKTVKFHVVRVVLALSAFGAMALALEAGRRWT